MAGSGHRNRPSDEDEDEPMTLKRLKSSPSSTDRISDLPEGVLVHIISLLSIRDRIKTGALSKSWKDLWTHVTNLHFNWADEYPSDFNYDTCVRCFNKTLTLASTTIESFAVRFRFDSKYKHHVDNWVQFAVTNEFEVFELDFSTAYKAPQWLGGLVSFYDDKSDYYTLPEHLYTNSSFRELRFSYCSFNFAHVVSVSWNTLKKLYIAYSVISDELVEKIVAGAPVLEVLDLYLVRLVGGTRKKLQFGNSALKKLILYIGVVGSWYDIPMLEISAPNLQSLELKGEFRNCRLVDMTSLVHVSIIGSLEHNLNLGSLENKDTICSLSQVQTLTLGTSVIQDILRLCPTGAYSPLSKCKCLSIVDIDLLKTNPTPIAKLLEICPGIETLTVVMPEGNRYNEIVRYSHFPKGSITNYWTTQEVASYLRIVKINGFWAYREYTFWFVKFLLKKAKVLQKMIINLEGKGRYRGETEPSEIS